jgi:hypothetical protein
MITNNRQRENNIFSLTINNKVIYDQHRIQSYILEFYRNILETTNERLITLDAHLLKMHLIQSISNFFLKF